jgi:hypothetical protein
MDHQVKNYIDVQASRGKHAQPVNLKEERISEHFADFDDSGIESLQVSDLKDSLMPACGLNQLFGMRNGSSNGFLDQKVNALAQERAPNRRVFNRRHCNADRRNLAQDLLEMRKVPGVVFSGDRLPSG